MEVSTVSIVAIVIVGVVFIVAPRVAWPYALVAIVATIAGATTSKLWLATALLYAINATSLQLTGKFAGRQLLRLKC
ncbi:hypothetical protein A3H04_04605 [Candidatus Giovannonibacteria bacterium RIFCSPLOWO2_12_FULL_43_11c]|uniref:Uncharacterized protein n=1 Tax=Candidatus Giovannonibacteria bacterium RIFCSPHIGHO2_12_FULL_43_15 TaxID=1798341 RepID=A0A1F5WP29_9BACT|nr:MAG: hypothetical protein A3F23_03750 [Candidatus Giovannonibacteria bacterium RIFCSPHIGHO2_12_FULL_43_15]OGF91996.1 MAG: hypothetical protein A3H04_04605 [Candidatus Giovannonibacteria bacterium RIFCSPLOWO2_12_FULL_43_11c]